VSRITRSSDWKLKRAVWNRGVSLGANKGSEKERPHHFDLVCFVCLVCFVGGG
jgi:hypothetical protein